LGIIDNKRYDNDFDDEKEIELNFIYGNDLEFKTQKEMDPIEEILKQSQNFRDTF